MIPFNQTINLVARSPRFAIPAILTLAGGTALSTVCYAVMEQAVFRAIPYESPSRLVEVLKTTRVAGRIETRVSQADFERLRTRAYCFESLGYEVDTAGSLAVAQGREMHVIKATVSRGLVETLKIHPALGRAFGPSDFGSGSPTEVLLSFELWSKSLASSLDVVGRHVRVGGHDGVVIGVLPQEIRHPVSVADLWIPDTHSYTDAEGREASDKQLFARLRDGQSITSAQNEIASIRPVQLPGIEHTNFDAETFHLVSLADQIVGPAKLILELLLCACLIVQVIACLSVGHLLVARRMGRIRETGIRLALGCSRPALYRDICLETLVVVLGGLIGAVPAILLGFPIAASIASGALGTEIHLHLSASIVGVLLAIVLLSGLLCSVFPLILLRHMTVASMINGRLETTLLSLTAARLQEILVIAEVASVITLLLAFGLIAKSIHKMSTVALGFNPENLTYFALDAGSASFPTSSLILHTALERLSHLPFVASAAIGSTPPLSGLSMSLKISAQMDDGAWLALPPVQLQAVSGSYFSTLGIPIVKGRTFDAKDTTGSACVAIVNRTFANLVWSTDAVIGKRLDLDGGLRRKSPCGIIGVTGDSRDIALVREPEPELFLSDLQRQAAAGAILVIRATTNGSVATETVSRVLSDVDASRHIRFSTAIGAQMNRSMTPTRTRADFLGSLALAALILAAAGVYAAVTYNLSEREKEIGIRLAMGATPSQIASAVCRHYATLGAIGGLMGTLVAGASVRVFSRGLSLFEVRNFDFGVFASAFAICMFVVLASVAAPALRAARANPADLLLRDVT